MNRINKSDNMLNFDRKTFLSLKSNCTNTLTLLDFERGFLTRTGQSGLFQSKVVTIGSLAQIKLVFV